VDGGLFSCGDAHAAQGDGEVCVTGIECPLRATLRLTVRKRSLAAPSFRTPAPPPSTTGAYFGTMGLGPDLMDAARDAVRAMIAWLGEEHGLSREDAYVLCSVAGDLKIHEIVDAGVWNVGMTMPLAVLG
jgi:acetamidase/formamidase